MAKDESRRAKKLPIVPPRAVSDNLAYRNSAIVVPGLITTRLPTIDEMASLQGLPIHCMA